MANKEILLVAEVFSNEREIDKEIVFQAIESALEAATVKRHTNPIKARVAIDRKTGEYVTYRQWEVVDVNSTCPGDVEFPTTQVLLEVARLDDLNIQVGDLVEEEIESVDFGRIAAQTAKQVIIHKVREAERSKVVEAYKSRVGELITGIVKRIEKGSVYLDLGGHVEAFIAREDMIPREAIRIGDRIRGYLKDVRSEARGPQLFVSRTAPELLIALFRLEVPEVGEGLGPQGFVAHSSALARALSVDPPEGVPQFPVLFVSLAEFLLRPMEGRPRPFLGPVKTTVRVGGYLRERLVEFHLVYVPTHDFSCFIMSSLMV